MALRPIRIEFILDGSGVYYDPAEPPHLDALLCWALAPMHTGTNEPPGRNEEPMEIPLPLGKWHMGGAWGWCASALFPEDGTPETIRYWRKKFQVDRVELCKGQPNTRIGPTREYNAPLPLLLAGKLTAWALGDRGRVHQLLRKNIRYIGKKRSQGLGRVSEIRVDWCDEDYSLVRDGLSMRWLPNPDGWREVRPRPPYWNNFERVRCGEVGEAIE